jgi:hypothetical protein
MSEWTDERLLTSEHCSNLGMLDDVLAQKAAGKAVAAGAPAQAEQDGAPRAATR